MRLAISDMKLPANEDTQTRGEAPFYVDEKAVNDYYPFGMLIADDGSDNRSWQAGNYRYGYNGKENDNEVKGTGNQIDYGARIYDPRTARLYSLDPLSKQFVYHSPYLYADNSPIFRIDQDGLLGVWATGSIRGTYGFWSTAISLSVVASDNGIAIFLTPETGPAFGFYGGADLSIGGSLSMTNTSEFQGFSANLGLNLYGVGLDISTTDFKGVQLSGLSINSEKPKIKMGVGMGQDIHLTLSYAIELGTFKWEELDNVANYISLPAGTPITKQEVQSLVQQTKKVYDKIKKEEIKKTENKPINSSEERTKNKAEKKKESKKEEQSGKKDKKENKEKKSNSNSNTGKDRQCKGA